MARVREETVILEACDIYERGFKSKRDAYAFLKTSGASGPSYRVVRFIGPPVRVEVETIRRGRVVPDKDFEE